MSMGTDGIIAVVSAACGVATTLASAYQGGRRWHRIVSGELSLYSTMRESASTPREVAIAGLLKEDAFERTIRGLGYRASGGVPIRTDRSLARGGVQAFCGALIVDVLLTVAVYGNLVGRLTFAIGAALTATALSVALFLVGSRWPKTERNPLYSRAIKRRDWSEREWRQRLVDSEGMMLEAELFDIEGRCREGSLAPGDPIRLDRIQKRVAELKEEASSLIGSAHSSKDGSEQDVDEAVHGHVDDDGEQDV